MDWSSSPNFRRSTRMCMSRDAISTSDNPSHSYGYS
jgi:hypothetical protein